MTASVDISQDLKYATVNQFTEVATADYFKIDALKKFVIFVWNISGGSF